MIIMLQILQAVVSTLRTSDTLENGLTQVLRLLAEDSGWDGAFAVMHGPLWGTQLVLTDAQHEHVSQQRMVAGDISAALAAGTIAHSAKWKHVSELADSRDSLSNSPVYYYTLKVDNAHVLAVAAAFQEEMAPQQAQMLSIAVQQTGLWLSSKLCERKSQQIQAEADSSRRAMLDSQELSLLGSWDWDAESQKLNWTPMMYQIYGFDIDDESLPDLDTVRGIILEDDLALFDENMSAAYRGEAPEKITYRILRDGEVRYLESRATIELDEWESIIRMHGTLQDVTQARQHELQLAEMNATLEERVRLRTVELSELVEELKAFSYSVSHDLRAPLRAILAYATEVVENPSSEKQGEYLHNVLSSAKRMNRLIEDLLRLSKASTQEFRELEVDVSQICESVVAHLRRDGIPEHVDINIQPGLKVQGDPDLLRVAFDNLIANAVKYSAKVSAPVVNIRSAEPAAGFSTGISIEDNGAGFDEARVDSIFKPFHRLHSDDAFEGTGIGLATVARIISRHHGAVSAHSPQDSGAAFLLSFR